mgnify:CR=1 FL=1
MDNILDKLNDEQREAVATTEGYVRVIAGAGSGKTRALSHRFAYLVNLMGVLPSHILCVTFSNKSANEMRQRIRNLTGDNDTGYINTFHGFCVTVLQEDSHAIQYPKNFLVLDNSDIDAMLKTVYDERGLSLRDMTYSMARDMIEVRKTISEKEYYRDMLSMTSDELKKRYEQAEKPTDIVFYGYLYQERKCFGVDYNDLIVFTLHIFDKNPEIRLKWQKRLEYIMVDEFQDIDPLLHRLMEVLCAYHKNLFVVGDPDQTIYTWRGADAKFLLEFDQKFSPCHTVVMAKNYRSTPEILAAANSLISKNKERYDKNLLPVLPPESMPIYFQGESSDSEAKWITDEIQKLHSKDIPYSSMAILYRAHHVTRSIEDTLFKAEIPFTIYSGVQFFDRAEIKDAISYLRLVAYHDDLSFMRVANLPKRNLGIRRMTFLKNYAEENHCLLYEALEQNIDNEIFKTTKAKEILDLVRRFDTTASSRSVSELLRDILDESGYEKMLRTEGAQTRLDNIAELRQSIFEYEASCGEECNLANYLSHVALFTNRDAETETAKDRVKLMTIHAAKGLEFPHVFLAGWNEGTLPSRKTKTQKGMEEERRLAFVAMTRAEHSLYISSASGSDFKGEIRYPSRFILDIEADRLSFVKPLREELVKDLRDYAQKTLAANEKGKSDSSSHFDAGTKISHPILGIGEIISVDEENSAYEIKFDKLPTNRVVSFRVALTKI